MPASGTISLPVAAVMASAHSPCQVGTPCHTPFTPVAGFRSPRCSPCRSPRCSPRCSPRRSPCRTPCRTFGNTRQYCLSPCSPSLIGGVSPQSCRTGASVQIPTYQADQFRLDQGRRAPRILCYGDSNTAGFHDRGHRFQPYGQSLAEALTSLGDYRDVAVCGLSCFTTQDMIDDQNSARVKPPVGPTGKGIARILDEEGPHAAVLIMTGTNDLGFGHTIERIMSNIAKLHAICHDRGVPTVAIAATTSGNDVGRSLQKKLAKSLRQWALSNNQVLACLDIEEMVPRAKGSSFWESDGLHLSAAGSKEFGRRLAPRVADVLRQAGSSGGSWSTVTRSTRHAKTLPAPLDLAPIEHHHNGAVSQPISNAVERLNSIGSSMPDDTRNAVTSRVLKDLQKNEDVEFSSNVPTKLATAPLMKKFADIKENDGNAFHTISIIDDNMEAASILQYRSARTTRKLRTWHAARC